MEDLVASQRFWKGKRVFLTGHSGFKGSWLSLWLKTLGAEVHGYSNGAPTSPSLHASLNMDKMMPATVGDVRDYHTLRKTIEKFAPDMVIHMAAQALVRRSYQDPIGTYGTNVMGTANLLNACRDQESIRAVLNVTSDKCYENKEWIWGYRETDRLGGHDPYSCSKACAELITRSFSDSFCSEQSEGSRQISIATARAGNVIGGGDWGEDRLIPDCIRAFTGNKKFTIRNPYATRPWQYVLDPLNGYLLLVERLYKQGKGFSGAWNFGPTDRNLTSVKEIATTISNKLGVSSEFLQIKGSNQLHEARILKLDSTKSATLLNWHAKVPVEKAIDEIVRWTKAYLDREDLISFSIRQIESFYDFKGH